MTGNNTLLVREGPTRTTSTAGMPAYMIKAIIISSLVVFFAALSILLVFLCLLRERRRSKNQPQRSWPSIKPIQQPAKFHYKKPHRTLPSESAQQPAELDDEKLDPSWPSGESPQQLAELHNESLSWKHFGVFEMSADAQIFELPGGEFPRRFELE